jgi:putative sigma-54 modulation protein
MDTTEALKEYCNEKVERITKYFPDPIKAHIVLSCDRGYHHVADVVITLHNGIMIKGEESTEDMYSSIDLVMAKIERQVRRYKEKIRSHRPHTGPQPAIEVSHTEFEMPSERQVEAPARGERAPAAAAHKIIKKEKFFAKPLSVEEAVMQMNLMGEEFLVFSNAASREVNVVYRRKDGTYGLIETGPTA